jgi:hypothetical protein
LNEAVFGSVLISRLAAGWLPGLAYDAMLNTAAEPLAIIPHQRPRLGEPL